MLKIAWLLGCIGVSSLLLWRTLPGRSTTTKRALQAGLGALPMGAVVYYLGAIASTFIWGA